MYSPIPHIVSLVRMCVLCFEQIFAVYSGHGRKWHASCLHRRWLYLRLHQSAHSNMTTWMLLLIRSRVFSFEHIKKTPACAFWDSSSWRSLFFIAYVVHLCIFNLIWLETPRLCLSFWAVLSLHMCQLLPAQQLVLDDGDQTERKCGAHVHLPVPPRLSLQGACGFRTLE